MRESCPTCGGDETIPTVTRDALVTMQNYVYRTREHARQATTAPFELRVCVACGYAFNSLFDSSLLQYDPNYDNSVPSARFETYCRDVARFLQSASDIDRGLVVDIGCGKGRFLRILAEEVPTVRGLGIDPSYEAGFSPASADVEARLTFVRDVFRGDYLEEKPAFGVCRHVLEHIPQPVVFLREIEAALSRFGRLPVFVEVPDLDWIIENRTFWDFCYEHCNYFAKGSLNHTLRAAGLCPREAQQAFGGQYLWSVSQTTREANDRNAGKDGSAKRLVARLQEYAEEERALMTSVQEKLESARRRGKTIVVWGMSTKGVLFSNLLDPMAELIDVCVDINRNKQGAFVPHTGHQITSPEKLASAEYDSPVIVVMNPNYMAEIERHCHALGLQAQFMDAHGQVIE